MNIWLFRAGKHGEHEEKFLRDSRVYITWDDIGVPLDKIESRDELRWRFAELFPDSSEGTLRVWASEVWDFSQHAAEGDFTVVPSRTKPGYFYVGTVVGGQSYDPEGDELYRHFRPVKWISRMQRGDFPPALGRSLRSRLTISRMARTDEKSREEFVNAVMKLSAVSPWRGGFDFARDMGGAFVFGYMPYPDLTGSEILNAFSSNLKGNGISLEPGAGEFIALAFRSMSREPHQLWKATPSGVEQWLRSTYEDLPFHLLFAAGRPERIADHNRIRLNEKGFKPVGVRLHKLGFFEVQHYVELNIVAFNPFPRNAG